MRSSSPNGLTAAYPQAMCELDHRNPFELLAATILSAQTTDARVNLVTPELFARYPGCRSARCGRCRVWWKRSFDRRASTKRSRAI